MFCIGSKKAHLDMIQSAMESTSDMCVCKDRKFPISAEMQLSAAAACIKRSSCESAFMSSLGYKTKASNDVGTVFSVARSLL